MKFLIPSVLLVMVFSAANVFADEAAAKEGALRRRDLVGNGNNGNGNDDGGSGNGGDPPPRAADPVDAEPDEPGPDVPTPSDDDDKVDVDLVATMLGLAQDDAKLLMKQQREFAALVDQIGEDSLFSRGEMPRAPNAEFVIKYKNGNVPGHRHGLIDEFKSKNPNAKVDLKNARLSRQEAEARGARLAEKLRKQGYGHVGYAIDGDEVELSANLPHQANGNGPSRGRVPPSCLRCFDPGQR